MSVLDARQAYRLWAATYAAETAVSFLDERLALAMLKGLPCKRLLDAGCGNGRRMARIDSAIGVDASPEMIASGANDAGSTRRFVADIRALPFADDRFDMVWCRLVLGHLSDPLPAYRELARVCGDGGHVFVTDFHPDAVAAGARRSFRDVAGARREVEHHVHADHSALAALSGLRFVNRCDAGVGPAIRDFYAQAGKLAIYERDLGLKLVDAFLFRRPD